MDGAVEESHLSPRTVEDAATNLIDGDIVTDGAGRDDQHASVRDTAAISGRVVADGTVTERQCSGVEHPTTVLCRAPHNRDAADGDYPCINPHDPARMIPTNSEAFLPGAHDRQVFGNHKFPTLQSDSAGTICKERCSKRNGVAGLDCRNGFP
jgi:hypothetical protein